MANPSEQFIPSTRLPVRSDEYLEVLRKIALASASSAGGNYETVAASQSDQTLGATGAQGDYLSHLLLVPASVDAGAVSIKDGSGSAITIFEGGTGSLGSLVPMTVAISAVSGSGAWKVTTGADISVVAFGIFT